ncbi:mobile element protein [Streptomyces sp. L-9-10]|nr:mobile element protein [Streptomyces sp. L-9-10]
MAEPVRRPGGGGAGAGGGGPGPLAGGFRPQLHLSAGVDCRPLSLMVMPGPGGSRAVAGSQAVCLRKGGRGERPPGFDEERYKKRNTVARAVEVAMSRIAGRFSRCEPCLRAGRSVLGPLSDLPRKNCWTIAEWAGEWQPAQHATSTVPGLLGCRHRPRRRARRELYIPRSWTSDPDRCLAAGLGEGTVFTTRPEPARMMIERFLDAGHHVDRSPGTEVYGGNPKLRTALDHAASALSWRWPVPPQWPPVRACSTSRRRVKETFQTEKGLAGLDEHQVRRYLLDPLGHPRDARSLLRSAPGGPGSL